MKTSSQRSKSRFSSGASARSFGRGAEHAPTCALLLDELREVDVPESGRLAEKDIQSAGWLLDLSDLTGMCARPAASKDPPFAPMTRSSARHEPFDVRRFARAIFSSTIVRFVQRVGRAIPREAARDNQVWRSSSRSIALRATRLAGIEAQRGKQWR
jgi:hypothetical protein